MIVGAWPGLGAWPAWVGHHDYALLFAASVAEGPLVTVAAAVLASQGLLNLAAAYATVVLGDLAGDALYYAAGRWLLGRLPLRGARTSRLRRRVDALRGYLLEHPGRVLLFGKLTHSAGFAVLLAAGAARLRPERYMLYNLLGTLPKSALLMLVGYFCGRFYENLRGDLRVAGAAGLVLAVLGLLALAWQLRAVDPAPPE